jgi:hypothetical protein
MSIVPALNMLFPDIPVLNISETCMDHGVFLRGPGGVRIDQYATQAEPDLVSLVSHLRWLLGMGTDTIQSFRAALINSTITNGTVAVDKIAAGLTPHLSVLFPGLTVKVIPRHANFTAVVGLVSDASVLITTGPSSLFFSVFLPPNATIVEIQPNGLECAQFGEEWASLIGIRYMKTGSRENCEDARPNLTKYFEDDQKYAPIVDRELVKVIRSAINTATLSG